MRVKRGFVAFGIAAAVGIAAFVPGAGVATAQECHYAYGGCHPIVYDLDCAEIGWAVVEVFDVYDDPYGLDVLYGPGNGWTCDGVG